MTIQDIVSHFNTIPFLFVGSGITRRYYNLPDWKGLLTEFSARVNSDRFAYRAYESKAQQLGSPQGVLPKIATLIQQDFDAKWYNTPTMRTNESFVLNAVERGCSPFKAEIAWYLKEQSVVLPEYKEEIRHILEPYQFDFLVGAIHSIDGLLYDMPWSKELLWEKYNVDDIYHRYYELIFDLVKSDLFTQLAHPDTIKMFGYYPTYDLKPTYHELAELLVEHHVKGECNTGCYYRYHHPDKGLSKELLDIFKEHHVDIITASDAHKPADVGTCIKDIYKLCQYD